MKRGNEADYLRGRKGPKRMCSGGGRCWARGRKPEVKTKNKEKKRQNLTMKGAAYRQRRLKGNIFKKTSRIWSYKIKKEKGDQRKSKKLGTHKDLYSARGR